MLLYLHLKQFDLTETFEFVENKRLGRVTLNVETVEFLIFFQCIYISLVVLCSPQHKYFCTLFNSDFFFK